MKETTEIIARLKNIESAIVSHDNTIQKIKNILKGIQMNKDYDFDELLNEIDEIDQEETPEPTPEKAEVSLEDLLDEPEDLVPEDEDLFDNPAVEEIQETQDSKTDDITITDTAESPLEDELESLKQENKRLADLLEKALIPSVPETELPDFPEETKAYARAVLDCEIRKQAIQQEKRELKDEWQDQGVDTVATARAMGRLARSIKQSPEEAKDEQQIEEMLQGDEGIFSTIAALNA